MARAVFMALLLVLAAAAAQEDCQAGEAEEVGLLQGRRQIRSHGRGSKAQARAEGHCCYGGLGCNYTGPPGCLILPDCGDEESCAECYPPVLPSDHGLEGALETYWCPPESLPEAEPTPAPTPYAGPFWTPGFKVCYIGTCTSGPTYAWDWCSEPCTETQPDGNRQFCPNGMKATRMTQWCHYSEENCEGNCNGYYSDYSPPPPANTP